MTYAVPATRVVIEEDNVNAGLYADMLGLSLQDGQLLDTLVALPLVPAECFPCAPEAAGGLVGRLNAALSGFGVVAAVEGAGWRMSEAHKRTLENRLAAWI
jgi:hypothetical protein